MTDKKLTVNKVDADGNPVIGAEMAAIDEKRATEPFIPLLAPLCEIQSIII